MPYQHTNTKSFNNNGIYKYKEIGSQILVWSRDGNKPLRNTRGVVISAHGGYSKGQSFTVRPYMRIFFYAPHGYSLNDPSMHRVVTGNAKFYGKPLTPGDTSYDYVLSKYQGKHGGKDGDDYAMISSGMHPETLEAQMARLREQGLNVIQQTMPQIKYDVVTIRNRKGFYKDVTLSGVIDELRKHGYEYNEVHCSFCRCPVSYPWSTEAPSWSVDKNTGQV